MKVFVEASEVTKGRFIDTRFNLQDKEWGKKEFELEHIEGAIFWDLESDLSDLSKADGRHPMPAKENLQNLFEQSGLHLTDYIYIYDQGGAPFASRAWWMLKFAGFPNVYIVNGGMNALQRVGFKTTKTISSYQPTQLDINWNEMIYASREQVKQVVDGNKSATLLDARSAVRYRGEYEPIDKVAGHIPTAKNFDWEQLKEGNTIRPNQHLLQTVNKKDDIIVYCGSGVTASPLYAVLADAGYENIRLYVGSYSDWITKYEVEVGESK